MPRSIWRSNTWQRKVPDYADLQPLIPVLLDICQSAGEAILAVYQSQTLEVSNKPDLSPVTRADIAAHQIILDRLVALEAWPVLSEEGFIPPLAERKSWLRYWLVDPLDGTKEFLAGNGEFTVNIALINNHRPVLGVIYAPVSGTAFYGLVGSGATKTQLNAPKAKPQAIRCRRVAPRLAQGLPLEILSSRRVQAPQLAPWLNHVTQYLGPVAQQALGSSLKCCLIAEGLADAYPRFGPTSEWDTAAAQAILEAAGGALVTTDFSPLTYNLRETLLNPHFFALGDSQAGWPKIYPGSQGCSDKV